MQAGKHTHSHTAPSDLLGSICDEKQNNALLKRFVNRDVVFFFNDTGVYCRGTKARAAFATNRETDFVYCLIFDTLRKFWARNYRGQNYALWQTVGRVWAN